MSLLMPQAGSDPGRAARAGEVVANTSGANAAQLGNIAADIGVALENDRRDRNFQRAQVDLTREVNELRLGVEEIGDPDRADAFFQQGVQGLRQKYLEDAGDEPVLDPANRDRFGIAFDRLVDSTAFSVGARNLGLRQSQRQATFIEFGEQAALTGAGANAQTRAALFAQGDEMIASDLEAGVITPEEATRRRLAIRENVSNAHAIRMIGEDPQQFLTAAEQGDFPGIPADTLERYRNQAKSAIATAETKAQTEAERAARARQTEIGNRLTEMRAIMGDGREAVDEAFLADPEVRNHPDYAETMAARALREEGNQLALMTPAQIDALIAGEKTKKVARDFQTERLKVLEDWRDRHEDGYASDPIAHARDVGHQIIDLPDFDPADPGAFAQALTHRTQQGMQMLEQGFTGELRILDDDEREVIRERLDWQNDPAERAALAGAVAGQLSEAAIRERAREELSARARQQGGEAPSEQEIEVRAFEISQSSFDRLSNMVGDKVALHAGSMMANGGSRRVAEEMLRGQQAIKQGNVELPPVRDRTEAIFASLEDFFADVPGGEALQSRLREGADALYAGRIRRSDPAGDIDTDVYRQALHEVMGGQGGFDARDAKGGMQEVRGALTPLPRGIGARDVETMVQGLSRDLLGLRQPEVPGAELREIDTIAATGTVVRPISRMTPEQAQARASAFLQAASLSGGQPGINGEPLDADALGTLTLRAVGPDAYQFVAPDGRAIADLQSGGAFEFRLSDLVRRYRR